MIDLGINVVAFMPGSDRPESFDGLPDFRERHKTRWQKATLFFLVGRTGFEPATPWSQTRYSTGLNYLPNICAQFTVFYPPYTSFRRDLENPMLLRRIDFLQPAELPPE